MNKTVSKKQFAIYLIVTFVLGCLLQIAASCVLEVNQTAYATLLMITMYAPFLGMIIAKFPLKKLGWVPHLKGKLRYVCFALWMPAVLGILGGVLFFAFFPESFDTELLTLREMMEKAGALEQLEEQVMTLSMYLLTSGVSAVTYAPFVNMFLALGEEVGWRGAMYPFLKEKFGVFKGRVIGGVIWGAFHWPIMLLAGYEYGKDYIGAPVLGPVVFCIACVLMGILLDHVYEKTGSIWLPSLMHGAANAFNLFAFLMKPEYSEMMIFGPMYIGVISMIPMAVAVGILYRKKKSQLQESI